MQDLAPFSGAAEDVDSGPLRLDEHIFQQRIELSVMGKFGPSVVGGGGVGQYLDHQNRVVREEVFPTVGGVTSDKIGAASSPAK